MKKVLWTFVAAGFLAFGGAVWGQGDAQRAPDGKSRSGKPATVLAQQVVTAKDAEARTITVKAKDGLERTIALTGATKIKREKTEMTLDDISAGDTVTIYFKKTGDGQEAPSTIKVMRPGKQAGNGREAAANSAGSDFASGQVVPAKGR